VAVVAAALPAAPAAAVDFFPLIVFLNTPGIFRRGYFFAFFQKYSATNNTTIKFRIQR